MIDDLQGRLRAWVGAGLLSSDQADAIAEHERARVVAAGQTDARRGSRATSAEAIGYVGAALVLGAVALFVGDLWIALTPGGRLTLALLITTVLGGAVVALRASPAPALARLASVLSVGVVAGVAWSAAVVGDDLLDAGSDDVALVVALAALAAAVPLYLWHRRALPQLALLASVAMLIGALLARPDLAFGSLWSAIPFAALGVVWLLLADGGYLTPRGVGGGSGAALALVALQGGSFGDERVLALVLAVAAAAGLVALAVAGGAVHHLGVGAVGLFVLVPQLVFEAFGDAIGAPATLLLVGVLLVLLAVGIGRARREVATGGAS